MTDPDRLVAAERLRDIAVILADQLTVERAARRQRRDAQGRLLFVGNDGWPTLESTAPEFVRARSGEVLFAAPDDPSVGLTQAELWEQHFIHKPHGVRRLEAWVRDLRNAQHTVATRAPWLESALADPTLASRRARDVAQLLGEVARMEASVVEPSAPPGRAQALEACRACLSEHAAALGVATPVPFDETLVPRTTLSAPLLEAAVRHHGRLLVERVRLARSLSDWLGQPSPRPRLDVPVRACLLEVLDACPGPLDREADLARLVTQLLDAEAIIERAERAERAVEAAEDFAAQGLAMGLRGLTG